MNTKISITSNGNVAPNRVFDFGFKYENVGDTLSFNIPEEYKGYHHYLVFYMKKVNTILLPVNDLVFTISTTLTRHAGTYKFIFIATENAVENGDIDGAKKVFVSNTMQGLVKDNDLNDPVVDEELDPNLQIVYDALLDLQGILEDRIDSDYYRGAYYIPDLDEFGNLSFTRSDLKDIDIPIPRNVTGPRGAFFIPQMDNNGQITWRLEMNGDLASDILVNGTDLLPKMQEVSQNYIDEIIDDKVENEVERQILPAIDNKFQWVWDEDTKSLYIYTNADSTSISEEQYNSILSILRKDGLPTGAVIDSSYVHTDNNYTDADKAKIMQLETELSDLNAKYEALMKYITGGGDLPDVPDVPTDDSNVKAEDEDGNVYAVSAIDDSDGTTQVIIIEYDD